MFFGFVEHEEMDNICMSRQEVSHKKGDIIINTGDIIKEFIYLKEGLVKLFRTDEDGKIQIIAIGKPLDFVSLLSVFSDEEYKYSVAAIEDSVTCKIKLDLVTSLAEENGKFAFSVMRKMSRLSDNVIIGLIIDTSFNITDSTCY